jgi:hypothetical protein
MSESRVGPTSWTYIGSGGIDPRILNFDTRWGEWSASRTCRFIAGEWSPGTLWIGSWVGPRGGLDAVAKKMNPCPRRVSNPGRATRRLVTTLAELPRLLRPVVTSSEHQSELAVVSWCHSHYVSIYVQCTVIHRYQLKPSRAPSGHRIKATTHRCSVAKVQNAWSLTPTTPVHIHIMAFGHRGGFIFIIFTHIDCNGEAKVVPVLFLLSTTPWRRIEGVEVWLHTFFDLGTRWRRVVSFTPRPLYPQGKSPWYPLYKRLGGPQSRSGRSDEEKNSQLPPGIEP